MSLEIAIVGKPNVGKSSLFNKLCRKRIAIVDDKPGVTRDRKKFAASLMGLDFTLVDTAGWEQSATEIKKKMNSQSEIALQDADIVLFMLDGTANVTIDDIEFADIMRRYNNKTLLLINKSECKLSIDLGDIAKLGMGDPIYISAHSGFGFDDLHLNLKRLISSLELQTTKEKPIQSDLKLAIIGKPNVGKSTIFNKILGSERIITNDASGTTRDSIFEVIKYENHMIELIDTAGIKKRKNIDNNLEDMSVGESINAIRRANVVILVIDATEGLQQQDMAIAKIAINEGKGIILVINKCDKIQKMKKFRQDFEHYLESNLRDAEGLSCLYISAIFNQGIQSILQEVIRVYHMWLTTIKTGPLNKWLNKACELHIPPLARNGRRIRMKYVVQTKNKPPTFNVFSNIPEDIPESYTKYLVKSLRKNFTLQGIPVRLTYTKNKNPYDNRG